MSLPIRLDNLQLRPYWICHYQDGRTVTEETTEWSGLEKQIQSIQIQLTNKKLITLSGNDSHDKFFQFKEGQASPDGNTSLGICIGKIVNRSGDCVFAYVNFNNGNITMGNDNVLNPKYPFLRLNLDYFGINLEEK